jgi:hypothetical protein
MSKVNFYEVEGTNFILFSSELGLENLMVSIGLKNNLSLVRRVTKRKINDYINNGMLDDYDVHQAINLAPCLLHLWLD